MKQLAAILLALAALLAALALFQRRGAAPATGTAPTTALTVYCAAGLKQPVEAIAAKYRAEFGVEVQLQYGPTGALISNLRVAKRGDLFIAADDGSVADARKFELVREVLPLVRQHPVIAVRVGNPKNIRTLADLLRDDVKLALSTPDAASISRVPQAAPVYCSSPCGTVRCIIALWASQGNVVSATSETSWSQLRSRSVTRRSSSAKLARSRCIST